MDWKKISLLKRMGIIFVAYVIIGVIVYVIRTILQGHFIDDPAYVLVWPSFILEMLLGFPYLLLAGICKPCAILFSIIVLILGLYLIYLFIKKTILLK